MYQKKENFFLQKMSLHLSQLNVVMAHRNYFRRNNLWILKFATYTYVQRLKITILLGANRQHFRLERIAKCSYFILSTQNIKFYWFVMNIKKFLLPIWWYNRDSIPLGNKYFGVFFLNGLLKSTVNCCHCSFGDFPIDQRCIDWSASYPIQWWIQGGGGAQQARPPKIGSAVIFSSPEPKARVSYCRPFSSVVRRPSCVVRRPSCVVRRPSSVVRKLFTFSSSSWKRMVGF